MQIKYIDDQRIGFEEETRQLAFNYDGEQIELDKSLTADLINSPGEYEYADVSLKLLEVRELKTGQANLFKITIGDVDILVLGTTLGEIAKDNWEEMGDVDILIINAMNNIQDLQKVINQVAPTVVIALVGKKAVDVAKLTGIDPEQTDKKFKFSNKDFQEEEPVTKLYVLG